MEKSELEMLYRVMVETDPDPDHMPFLSIRRRTRPVVERKQMLAAVARHYGTPVGRIAAFVGWINHTTALFAIKQVKGYMEVYPETRRRFETICEEYEFRKTVGLLAGDTVH